MTVTVYSKPQCMQCDFTKKFLDENHIAYTSVDVTADDNAREHVANLGFQSLPVVEASGFTPWFGFRPDQLEKLVSA